MGQSPLRDKYEDLDPTKNANAGFLGFSRLPSVPSQLLATGT